jgi:hypothetical protein
MNNRAAIRTAAWILAALATVALGQFFAAPAASAQGSRKDDIVFGPSGHPISGATVTVCQATATGTPCSPLATIYTDATLTVPALNSFQGDGIGNYYFYAPPGRYLVQITGPQITGTITFPDVILPADLSSTAAGNNISAFGLTLGGNLSVTGNATITGTLTATNFNPGTFSPTSLAVPGNISEAGPRPYVDVTAPPYNADPTGATDSTASIRAAINAACLTGGSVYFPPSNVGYYKLTQPQTPSTSPVLVIPCSGMHLIGGNSHGAGGSPSNRGPVTELLVQTVGASPNALPVFALGYGYNGGLYPNNGTTFENLNIVGHNQAVAIYATGQITFKNTTLSCFATSQTDNTPWKATNSIEVTFSGGGLNSPTGVPASIWTGETSVAAENAVFGIVHMQDVIITSGLGMEYIQRVASGGPVPGDWHLNDVVMESATNDFMTVTNTSGSLMTVTGISYQNVQTADSPNTQSMLFFNGASGDRLSGVVMNQALAGSGGSAIKMATGTTLSNYQTNACSANCTQQVVDTSGNPVGTGQVQDYGGGLDFFDATTTQSSTPYLGGLNNTSARFFKNGAGAMANLGIDAWGGYMFNDGTSYGFNASLSQNAKESLDVQFAKLVPPTGVTATAAAGGSIPNGTYYVWVSTTSDNCGTQSAASLPSSAVVLTGSNGTINVGWTLPIATISTPTGYCVGVTTSLPSLGPPGNGTAQFVTGATSTTFAATSTTGVTAMLASNTQQGVHRFTMNSLGVNTTSPQYNLDVNGSAAVNSLNSVQKAERFAGSDAAAQINACLTAASTTSGVCDARGLTGTYTGAAHITIPKGTTLQWCQGKLTINDSTTHDAIELGGDGASLFGCQESGLGTVPRPETSGYIACGIAGCTTVDNPNSATANIDWVHINGMYLQAFGASSIVLNMTSIGHADIENDYFVLGTGGNSYGIYGNTSTGDLDSTNSLIKHNDFSPESAGDDCAYMAGVFNVVVFEQNSCYLPPAASQGFVLAKDSNGNYPDNDEFYGNDCETSSQAFNQICFNIIGAQAVVIGPNNRCENTYNCFQWPSDGSAVGIHLLDPYLSPSVNTVVKPNEPAAAQIAVDNNGHNWLPSMHYGMNDLAGDNLLGNAAFEGWQNTTTLYYWGGVSGTNINQAGSGIYLQNLASSSTPGVDPNTQGLYNLRVGDGATAGLGVNSGCVQVDSTMEYTLMFRVASGSTSNNFRPGFRFYWDANCTEADKITSVATNARILSPANYNGTSTTTANWQSSNASLTYNNGITCNCNVTGADWQVSTASAWTPTRNYGVTFRVPNSYGSSSTVAHSMRVFLLENTAAAGNFVYFDDVILSQGAVSQDFRRAALPDSGNPVEYGSLGISQHLNQGAANTFAGSIALVGGTATVTFPTAYNSAPVCTANDTSAIATVRVQTTATTLTLTQSSGTDTIMYICVGNPN